MCSLTAEGIRYSAPSNPDKTMLLIDLGGIESIGNYDTGKNEPAFQVKWKGTTTLHKCSDEAAVRNWVDKVMAAKLGPSNLDSDSSDSYDSYSDGDASSGSEHSSGEESVPVKSSGEVKKLSKSDEKAKASKDKSKASSSKASPKPSTKESSNKSKTAEVKSKAKDKPAKEKKEKKEKKSKTSKESSKDSKENGKKNEEAPVGAGQTSASGSGAEVPMKAGKRVKSVSAPIASPTPTTTGSYVPQWAAHYNGIKTQERQRQFEAMKTEELVKLVSLELEATAKAERERILQEWASQKRAKLLELHALELIELQKKQQREIDDIAKRCKEFSEQPF
jgi:hypothetical protein